jgi:hypothetical protein
VQAAFRGDRNGLEYELRRLGIRQKTAAPATQTQGKAERFRQTSRDG